MSDAPSNITTKYDEILPGIFAGVPNEEYHASDGISCSDVKEIGKSIEHYEYRKSIPHKQTDAMVLGSALHDRMLLPDVYNKEYIVSPVQGKTTKTYKEFKIKHSNKIILTPSMKRQVDNMEDSINKNPTMRSILDTDTTLKEVSIWSVDPDTGLLLKCRLDILCDGYIDDIKTTSGSVSPGGFKSNIWKYGYYIQAPFYIHVSSLVGLNIRGFIFLVVGSVPPYSTAIYEINQEDMLKGEEQYREALTRYSRYLNGEDTWTGLPNGREVVVL